MKLPKSRRSLNGWNKEHTNREAESQRESVAINQNRIVEIKQSKRRISLNGLIVEHTNREAESQRESVAINRNGMVEINRSKRRIRSNGLKMKHSNCCVEVTEILTELHRQPDPRSNQHVIVANQRNQHLYDSLTPLTRAEITRTYLF